MYTAIIIFWSSIFLTALIFICGHLILIIKNIAFPMLFISIASNYLIIKLCTALSTVNNIPQLISINISIVLALCIINDLVFIIILVIKDYHSRKTLDYLKKKKEERQKEIDNVKKIEEQSEQKIPIYATLQKDYAGADGVIERKLDGINEILDANGN